MVGYGMGGGICMGGEMWVWGYVVGGRCVQVGVVVGLGVWVRDVSGCGMFGWMGGGCMCG